MVEPEAPVDLAPIEDTVPVAVPVPPELPVVMDGFRDLLGQAVGLHAREVNVKFASNEGMGAIGRGEGIAAIAVATLDRLS